MPRPVTIGLAQMTGEPYAAAANRDRSVAAARELLGRGARIVVLPEMIVPGYAADRDRLMELGEAVDGPTVSAWRAVAAEHGGWIAGGFCERVGDTLFNSAVIVGAGGVELHYRKLHPFREEKHAFARGDLGLPVVELPFGRVALCVCYDLRFVETVRVLALEGAELVCVPTAWLAGFDERQWNEDGLAPQAEGAILQANLDQVFIACASQVGRSDRYEFLGSSIVAGPRGEVLTGPLPIAAPELALAQVDLDDVQRAQIRHELIRPREDRRRDVYGLMVGDRVL
ncbi:MAG TPA: nitrilase-related carbon-nitrogen hydrolase [Solirubrobacteraceae bacterium]|nr:nitrilase-related carbon-nitrogen hydrolase [Solirubrobacteraceae bacterium]